MHDVELIADRFDSGRTSRFDVGQFHIVGGRLRHTSGRIRTISAPVDWRDDSATRLRLAVPEPERSRPRDPVDDRHYRPDVGARIRRRPCRSLLHTPRIRRQRTKCLRPRRPRSNEVGMQGG